MEKFDKFINLFNPNRMNGWLKRSVILMKVASILLFFIVIHVCFTSIGHYTYLNAEEFQPGMNPENQNIEKVNKKLQKLKQQVENLKKQVSAKNKDLLNDSLAKTSNILSKTSFLLVMFSILIIVLTLVMGFLGSIPKLVEK